MEPFIFSDILWLPDEPGFQQTIIDGWQWLKGKKASIAIFGDDGLIRDVEHDSSELDDYLEGGEYDQVIGKCD